MKTDIKEHIEQPEHLEQLYQSNQKKFKIAFEEIYLEIRNYDLAEFWKIRLGVSPQKSKTNPIQKTEFWLFIISCLFTALLIKIPKIFGFDPDTHLFYEKNTALIVFFGITTYAFLTNKSLSLKKLWFLMPVLIGTVLYINLLPVNKESQSLILSYIHLPLMLWCLYGLVYIEFNFKDLSLRITYIKHNADLAILGALILICGGILTGVTLGLFSAIDISIEKFYSEYIVICGLVVAPIVATFIVKKYAIVSHKIPPIIANIFSPLVLITLVIYLFSIAITGKDPYNNRDFLIVFNLMLLGVISLIVYSVSECSTQKQQKFNIWVIFSLTIVTLLVNLIAISAILYRLNEFGLSPNRAAVLGSNLLIFGNLILILIDFYKVIFKSAETKIVEMSIAKYIPIYMVWTVILVFLFPLLFWME